MGRKKAAKRVASEVHPPLDGSAKDARLVGFLRALVNHDLPWNPMEIEQRIGRVFVEGLPVVSSRRVLFRERKFTMIWMNAVRARRPRSTPWRSIRNRISRMRSDPIRPTIQAMTRLLAVVVASSPIGPAVAGPVEPAATLAPVAGAVCLASPARTLAWFEAAVSRARSLGLPVRGVETVSRWTLRELGADLLSPRDWKKTGLDPSRPVCLAGPVPGSGRVVVTFGVTETKKVVDLARRLAARRDPAVGPPKPTSLQGAKVWTFRPGKEDEVLALAVRDRTGFLAASREDLASLLGLATPDPSAGWDLPDGDVVVAARLDLPALAAVMEDDDIARTADRVTPEIRADLVVAGREARLEVRGRSVGLLALVGGVLEKTPPGAGRTAIERLDGGASGFLQVRLPLRAILEALKTLHGQGAPGAGPLLPPGWDSLVEALSGDLLLAAQDGLAGLTLTAEVGDEGAARRGIAGIGESLRASGVPVAVEDLDEPGARAWRFRVGAPDSPIRFPVFVAVRDGLLTVSLSRARLVAAMQAPASRYVDALDHPLVRDGLASGAFLVAHGTEADSLGGLLPYAAIVRDALNAEAATWMDLFDWPALAADLLLDAGSVATLSSSEWSLRVVARFLGADPGSADPGEQLFAQAVRARMEGRVAAAREALFTLAQTGRNGAYGRKARRCLMQPEPVSDVLVGAVVAGALFAWQARLAEPEGVGGAVPGEDESGEEMTPCQQYLLRSCLGQDPEGPECRKARAFFEQDGPTAEDQEKCRSLLTP